MSYSLCFSCAKFIIYLRNSERGIRAKMSKNVEYKLQHNLSRKYSNQYMNCKS
jgi:hypothetical protein